MPLMGYHYYFTGLRRTADKSGRDVEEPSKPSITDTRSDRNLASGILLMSIVMSVPVIITALFILLFRV